jgi:hypothetical protein
MVYFLGVIIISKLWGAVFLVSTALGLLIVELEYFFRNQLEEVIAIVEKRKKILN